MDRHEVEQSQVGNRLVTTIRRVEPDGTESIETTGEYEPVRLTLEPEAGRETVLAERARRDHR